MSKNRQELTIDQSRSLQQKLVLTWQRWAAKDRLPWDTIYYCCTQKTASQWFKSLFRDVLFQQYVGMEVRSYQGDPDRIDDEVIDYPMARHSIATHLYVNYQTFDAIPKPKSWRCFFVLRDPRDIVVSWYYSILHSHPSSTRVNLFREKLQSGSMNDGIRLGIDAMKEYGLFRAQRSWVEASRSVQAENIRILRYEDFAEDNRTFAKDLFSFLGINMLEQDFEQLLDRHAFGKYAKGRSQGETNEKSHYRKGVSGDWIQHFDRTLSDYFRSQTGDLLDVLSYSQPMKQAA